MPSLNTLQLLDGLVASGQLTFTTAQAAERLGSSIAATSNALSRLSANGLVDRVARGHYAIRPIGSLGTSAAAEGIALAVGAVFAGRPHRIAYRSALAHHDLIVHPARVIQVACPDQVRVSDLSGRRLRVVMEPAATIEFGAGQLEHGAWVSSIERALIDAARRVDLVGGVEVVGEALEAAADSLDVNALRTQAQLIDAEPALRRLASVARVRGLDQLATDLAAGIRSPKNTLPADPRDAEAATWEDDHVRVRWSSTALDNVRQ